MSSKPGDVTRPNATELTVPTASGPVYARVDGPEDGVPISLVHGFSGSAHWFDELTALLAVDHRVLRVDLRGHGRTGGHTGLDPESQSAALAEVLGFLGIRDALAIGHSFGADVVLALARRSDRVREAGIIGQAPDYSYANLPLGGEIMTAPVLGVLLHRLAPPFAVRIGLHTAVAPGFPVDNAFADRNRPVLDHRAMSPGMYRVVLGERRARLAVDPLDAQVRALDKPCLVIHGDRDRMYDCARTVARYRDAGARVEIVAGAGHSPNIERPREVERIVRAFLAERAGRSEGIG